MGREQLERMDLVVFSGSANPPLAAALARELGLAPGARLLERFPDGEIHLTLREEVLGRDVAIVQSTGPPGGEHLLELLLLADACRRAGARRVSAVVPYLGYARQDRRGREGEPLGARVVADVLSRGRFARIFAVDLHVAAIEGCFEAPLEHLTAVPALVQALRPHVTRSSVIVSPDLGAVKRAEAFARQLELPVAIVHKTRLSGAEVSVREVVGDVRGRSPILVDDIVATGGTIVAATEALRARGCAQELTVVATHALLVGPAVERLRALSPRRLVTTDSLPPLTGLPFPHQVVSLGPLLAEALRRVHGPVSGAPPGGRGRAAGP